MPRVQLLNLSSEGYGETHRKWSSKQAGVCLRLLPGSIWNKSVLWETHEEETLDVFLGKASDHELDSPPVQSGFSGQLQVFQIPAGKNNIDLLEFMVSQRKNIEALVLDKVQAYPQKVQFIAHIDLMKPAPLDESEEKETTVYANSEMTTVYSDGLTDDQFFDMVEKMLSVLFIFASGGSGWVVSQINHVDVKMAQFQPIQGSSYIELPPNIKKCKYLLNIRNKDHNCFTYCFVAAYHMKYGPSLTREGKSETYRTNPETYRGTGIHVPNGNYPAPMSIKHMDDFEEKNVVNINVFR